MLKLIIEWTLLFWVIAHLFTVSCVTILATVLRLWTSINAEQEQSIFQQWIAVAALTIAWIMVRSA